jgi:hypothetical protein
MRVSYEQTQIRNQKTRWGNYSPKTGTLSLNFRLLMAPPEVVNYVLALVHELAHAEHPNHDPRFWRLVEQYVPDYEARNEWLKEKGPRLLFSTTEILSAILMSRRCAYCGTENNLTKEHIFSKGLLRRTDIDAARISRAPREFVNPNLEIKDVCETCNNERLSEADEYICNLYEDKLSKYVRIGEPTELDYDFDLLARWLMKTAYNSARASGADDYADQIGSYAEYMIGAEARPQYTAILVLLVAPYQTRDGEVDLEQVSDPDLIDRNGKTLLAPRVMGARSVTEYEELEGSISYMVIINSFYFIVSVFPNNRFMGRQTLRKMRERGWQVVPLGNTRTVLDPAELDFLEAARRFGIME